MANVNNTPKFEVKTLVVVAGPVGLALAGDFGWPGQHWMVVDQGDRVVSQLKMDLVVIRTMEFYRRWGLLVDVDRATFDCYYSQDNVYLTLLNGLELGRHPMQSMRANPNSSYIPQRRERCSQNMFDVVRQKFDLSKLGIDVRYGHEFSWFAQDAQGVNSRILDAAMGRMFMVWCRYLAGCEGGKCSEHEQMGIPLNGCGVLTDETMTNVGHYYPKHETSPVLAASLSAFMSVPVATRAYKGAQCTH
jgi:2-polyprenyl-6-methoxyphenol hydroxylase-like FAD-dependent oxidoreductase